MAVKHRVAFQVTDHEPSLNIRRALFNPDAVRDFPEAGTVSQV